ncbi:ATP-grasp domain-containing protein [Herbidospora mongoliensis]|uniref:ATP-grasp domain-containing protein n=1 Tax=Herbidospora mongoliensis TaxID=688067 RepID=UPI000B0E3672|nr:siderophore biosynthesis protein [Herbidospora mongoliensis]
MHLRLYLTTLNPTDSVTRGFLPAAKALGWEITVLTDRPEAYPGHDTIQADVRDPKTVIDVIARHHRPDVIFSNSDHLQVETALAADYFGLPGKDWRACLTAKNKALTRHALGDVRSARLVPGEPLPDVTFPVVVKPREGVASEDVVLVRENLQEAADDIWTRRPGTVLVAEEYLEGPLMTLETLGDGTTTRILGGFRTTLGPLPHFVEERLDWSADLPGAAEVLNRLAGLNIGFGACHTEYVLTGEGPRIVEVNYRVIGDNCDLLLADHLDVPLFEWILRVHAGEPAPEVPPTTGHAATVSVLATRSGTIMKAPKELTGAYEDVRLWHLPLKEAGQPVSVTNTNRDYLALLRAVGPDREAVDTAAKAFLDAHPWVVA